MAIQVRGGLLKDFDPNKMLPREWAVTTDLQTQRQMVYMCFAAGVVKRMGTYEDFQEQIKEIEEGISDYFYEEYQKLADEREEYIEKKVEQAEDSATDAQTSKQEAEKYAQDAYTYAYVGVDLFNSLKSSNSVQERITDSDGNPILDATGKEIMGAIVQYATMAELLAAQGQIDILTNRKNVLENRVKVLENNNKVMVSFIQEFENKFLKLTNLVDRLAQHAVVDAGF